MKPEAAAEDPIVPAAVEDPAPVQAATTGALRVLAVFADRTPLAGVNVSVGNESRETDATGFAQFAALPTGAHTLVATKAAHRAAQQEITIVAGDETRVEVVLAAEDGAQHSHSVGFGAHADHYRFEGHFDCTAVYLIVPGDCFIIVENATHSAGAPDPVSGLTNETNIIEFALDVNWSAMIVEMTWDEPMPPTSDGMTLALEPAEAPEDGHSAKYARVAGGSPLRIELLPGVKHDTATEEDMPNPDGGEVLRARTFVKGHAHNPAGTTYLGVGAAAQFDFVLYASIFYGEAPPQGYSAIE